MGCKGVYISCTCLHDGPVYLHQHLGLTDEDILINSMVFMSAGFDTTATTLGWLIYDLSLHPDVQEKIITEIDAEIGQVQLVLLVANGDFSPILR